MIELTVVDFLLYLVTAFIAGASAILLLSLLLEGVLSHLQARGIFL